MYLGFGLYRHQLTEDNLRFAVQAGATHLVVHLVEYFAGGKNNPSANQPTGTLEGWGPAGKSRDLWTADNMKRLRRQVEEAGLILYAIENLDPAHWYDILLDGPRWSEHIENVKSVLLAMGEAGIPNLGYYFSLAGVAGRITGPFARGGAKSVGMDGPVEDPLPRRMVWNMVVDDQAGDDPHPPVSEAALWDRFQRFLDEVMPVAEAVGVRMAAHPDDPPVPVLRGTPRLIYQPRLYRKTSRPSPKWFQHARTMRWHIGGSLRIRPLRVDRNLCPRA